jgi:hypothetical protein
MIFYSGAKIVRLCELCKDGGCICVAGFELFALLWLFLLFSFRLMIESLSNFRSLFGYMIEKQ